MIPRNTPEGTIVVRNRLIPETRDGFGICEKLPEFPPGKLLTLRMLIVMVPEKIVKYPGKPNYGLVFEETYSIQRQYLCLYGPEWFDLPVLPKELVEVLKRAPTEFELAKARFETARDRFYTYAVERGLLSPQSNV